MSDLTKIYLKKAIIVSNLKLYLSSESLIIGLSVFPKQTRSTNISVILIIKYRCMYIFSLYFNAAIYKISVPGDTGTRCLIQLTFVYFITSVR